MNEYGLDVRYFKEKLRLITRDVDRYTPSEMERALLAYASVVRGQISHGDPEFKAKTFGPKREKPTDEYKSCNHHHEVGENHELVDFGDGEFVANKAAIPLLKALNEIGLKTRTHHYDGGEHGFISVLLEDGVTSEIKIVNERDATRTKYNGKKELLIMWHKDPQ